MFIVNSPFRSGICEEMMTQAQSGYLSQEKLWTLTGISAQPPAGVSYPASLSCPVRLLSLKILQANLLSLRGKDEGVTMRRDPGPKMVRQYLRTHTHNHRGTLIHTSADSVAAFSDNLNDGQRWTGFVSFIKLQSEDIAGDTRSCGWLDTLTVCLIPQ